jgi:hypothetical protein
MSENKFEADDQGHGPDELEQKEAEEHKSFSKKQIHQIVLDHLNSHHLADHPEFKKIVKGVAAMDQDEAGESPADEKKEEAKVSPKNADKHRVEKMTAEHKKKHG